MEMRKSDFEITAKMFDSMAAGRQPSFFELLSALSEVSAVVTTPQNGGSAPTSAQNACGLVPEQPQNQRCSSC